MASDQLSDVFDLVEVRGVMSGGCAVRGAWVARVELRCPLKLVGVLRGQVRLLTEGLDTPMVLDTGDVAILNKRTWMVLEGGRGTGPVRELEVPEGDPFTRIDGADCNASDVVVGGHVDVNPAGEALLVQALPPVGLVQASAASAPSLLATLNRVVDELTGNRIGSAFAVRQHGQLLVLEVLRAYVEQADLPPGWLRALSDDRLRPALSLMHGQPGRPWGLEELARSAAMSRTSFAERFRTVAGVPPLTYLSNWRMLLAQRALRNGDTRVGPLAAKLGYSSESAFSNAFKRQVGISPQRYCAQMRRQVEPISSR